MASKNTNIVSKTLVESYIRKQVKALKQSPTETIDTLTKQLLDKPKGSLEKYLLHITPEKLQDTQSGYYKLFHDIRHRLAMQKRTEPVALCFLLKKMHGNCFLL